MLTFWPSKCASRHSGVPFFDIFSTSELQKVVRTPHFLKILTSKCASRHSGVQIFHSPTSKNAPTVRYFVHFDLQMRFAPRQRAIFRHRNLQKCSENGVFCTFWLANALRATAACHFSCLLWPATSAPAALASLLFDPADTQIIGKTQHFATSLTFRACWSSFYGLSRNCSFILLILLLFSAFHLLTLLLCSSFSTAKYYSSTTLYYKVLLQYYSVLHSTTTYYSSTTLYYKVLLQVQYYSVCTAKYYSSTTLYYKVLQRTTPVLLCTKVLLQYYSVLQSSIHDWSLTHMNRIYIARSNRSHPPTSPNTAPDTQKDCDDWSASHMKRHLQCAEQQESQSNFTKYCACHAKWISWLIRVSHETSFTLRGATGITIQLHQILRLPRKMNLMIDPQQIWNVIYNARSNRSHNPTSPNTAPATQSESHDWSASHMKRHLHCAEQQDTPSNFTKYCPCHEILSSRFQRKLSELLPPI